MQDNMPKKPASEKISSSSFNATDAARSPFGDLELTKYLYESGLQNIFNTYQQNVASLSQNKQQELQDAYYIREMSKKYLGEYASNVGMGDVSGNLLDIYGQYQSNLTDIERNYDQLQMGLDQAYQKQKTETMNNLLVSEFNLELAKFQEQEKGILFNIEMGTIPGGVDPEVYLQSENEKGNLSDESYREALRVVREQNLTEDERLLWGQLVRGEIDKKGLTDAYNAGQISQEAYSQFFNALEKEERGNVLYGIEYNIARSDFQGFDNVEAYLEDQLSQGLIDQNEFQTLMLKYSENPQVAAARDVEFNIANNSLPEGMTAKDYIQSEYDAGNISQADYQRLTLIENAKEQSVQAFEFVQSIIENNLPEGQTRGDAIANALREGIIDNKTAMELYDQVYEEERTQAAARVEYNLYIGETEGLSNKEYIQQQFAKGVITESQYQTLMVREDQQEKETATTDFLINFSRGNYPDGMSRDEYLTYGYGEGYITSDQLLTLSISQAETVLGDVVDEAINAANPEEVIQANTELTDEEKEIAVQTAYNTNLQEVAATVQGAFTDRANTTLVDTEGNIIRTDDPFADIKNYIESNRLRIGDENADRLLTQIEQKEQDLKIQADMNFNYIADASKAEIIGSDGKVVDNPYYTPALEGFDLSTLTTGLPNDSAINKDSKIVYFSVGTDNEPMQYITSGFAVDSDPLYLINATITDADLREMHKGKLTSGKIYAGNNPGEFFLYENNNFYRLIEAGGINTEAYSYESMKGWVAEDNPEDGIYRFLSGEKFDEWTAPDGTKWREKVENSWTEPGNNTTRKAIYDLFNTIHGEYGTSNKKPVVILYKGTYYNRDKNGEISPMRKI